MSENLFHSCSFYERIKGKHTVTKRQEQELGLRWTRVPITTSVHNQCAQSVCTTSEHNQCAQPVCTSSWDPGKQPALTSNVKTSPMVCRADVLRPKQARHSGARHRIWGPLKGHSPSHYGIMALTFLLFSFVFHCPPFRFAHKVLASCISCFTELFISMEVTGPTASPFIQWHSQFKH